MYIKDLKALEGKLDANVANLFSVKGKNVVISGAGRGIGLMIAMAFAQNGANIFLLGRDLKTLEEVQAYFSQKYPSQKFVAIKANLSVPEDCLKMEGAIKAHVDHLDVIINNAGANWGAEYEKFDEKAWERVISLNVKGVFHLTKALTPLLEAGAKLSQQNSRVINIGSVDGMRPPAMDTWAYSTSKAAVHMLSRHLAKTLAARHITVNAIAAGAFETKMMASTLEKMREQIEETTPLRRIGNPLDIGGVCLWLSSRAGDWITGTIITVDGGVLIGPQM